MGKEFSKTDCPFCGGRGSRWVMMGTEDGSSQMCPCSMCKGSGDAAQVDPRKLPPTPVGKIPPPPVTQKCLACKKWEVTDTALCLCRSCAAGIVGKEFEMPDVLFEMQFLSVESTPRLDMTKAGLVKGVIATTRLELRGADKQPVIVFPKPECIFPAGLGVREDEPELFSALKIATMNEMVKQRMDLRRTPADFSGVVEPAVHKVITEYVTRKEEEAQRARDEAQRVRDEAKKKEIKFEPLKDAPKSVTCPFCQGAGRTVYVPVGCEYCGCTGFLEVREAARAVQEGSGQYQIFLKVCGPVIPQDELPLSPSWRSGNTPKKEKHSSKAPVAVKSAFVPQARFGGRKRDDDGDARDTEEEPSDSI